MLVYESNAKNTRCQVTEEFVQITVFSNMYPEFIKIKSLVNNKKAIIIINTHNENLALPLTNLIKLNFPSLYPCCQRVSSKSKKNQYQWSGYPHKSYRL